MRTTSRPGWLFLLLAMIALLTLSLASACGGDDDDGGDGGNGGGNGGGNEPTATQDSGGSGDDDDDGGGQETPDNGGDDDGGDGNGDGGGDDDVLGDLENIAGSGENATGVVTYTFTDDTGSEGEWTIYTEGDNSRTDFVSEDGGFISITTPEVSYTCTVSGNEGMCFEGEGGVGANPFAGLLTQYGGSEAVSNYLELFSDVDVESSSEDIAGVDANCFTATGDFGDGDEGTIRWCFADNGLLLLSTYDLTSGTFEMRASDFSDDVPDDAFDPPYEVTQIPSG